jgi:HEAT repeat protein
MDPLPPELAGLAIRLLAWDEVAPAASEALGRVAARIVGQLTDALLDPDEEFAVRRRQPRVLQSAASPRAGAGLVAALADRRFEVRYRAARALVRLREKHAELPIDEAVVHAAVLRELAVDEPVWANLRLLDGEAEVDGPSLVDDELRARASRGLEQIFQLLSLVFPPDPIKIAFRGLHTDDQTLYGTALEYLESVLPESLRDPLWPRLQKNQRARVATRPRDEVLRELILSRDTIQLNLKQLHARAQAGPPGSTSGGEKS